MFCRDQQYEYVFSDDEEEEEESEERYSYVETSDQRDHLVADIIGGGESLMFLHYNESQRTLSFSEDQFVSPRESLIEDFSEENRYASDQTLSVHRSPQVSDFETEEVVEEEQEKQEQLVQAARDTDDDSVPNSVPIESDMLDTDKNSDGIYFTSSL